LLDIHPLVGQVVLREEHAEFVGFGRPASAEELDALVRGVIGIHELIEHVVERGIKILVGWIPGLQKKIVDASGVDGFDGGRWYRRRQSARRAWQKGRVPWAWDRKPTPSSSGMR